MIALTLPAVHFGCRAHFSCPLALGDPLEDLADHHRLFLVDLVVERPLRRLGLRRRHRRPPLVADDRIADGGAASPQAVMRPANSLPGVEVRPRVLHLAHVQPVGPIVVECVDVVGGTDDPHVGIHGRLEEFARLGVVAIEAARLLGDDDVPSLSLDAGPDLIDARAVGDLTADLGLGDHVDLQLLGLGSFGQLGFEERPTGIDLIVDTRLSLLLGAEPGLDEDAERLPLGDDDRLAEVHHFAPPFRPFAFLAF
jgi:hypothetical protein